jgi:hypothetical protein
MGKYQQATAMVGSTPPPPPKKNNNTREANTEMKDLLLRKYPKELELVVKYYPERFICS